MAYPAGFLLESGLTFDETPLLPPLKVPMAALQCSIVTPIFVTISLLLEVELRL